MELKTDFKSTFQKDVFQGLTDFPKHLSSKYFYDAKGDKLFQEIMAMPEYYVTQAELSIFEAQKSNIVQTFLKEASQGFDLIELGAGDGLKTKILLQEMLNQQVDFNYIPIDISQNALNGLEQNLQNQFPKLKVNGRQGEYFEVLSDLKKWSKRNKVILFLGSNIGNLPHSDAVSFLIQLRETLHPNDIVFVGFDLKKHPDIIEPAYNDSSGITAEFNKNVLHRINQELNANFKKDNFVHHSIYNPETGTVKSYLVSTKKQEVFVKDLDLKVSFEAWESIHTEISQKYDAQIIEWLCQQAGLKIATHFTDHKKWFANYVLQSKNIEQ